MQVRRRIARDAHVLNLFDVDARRAQTILNRPRGKAGAVLDAIEALFLDGRDQPTVFDQRRRRITVIGIDAEDVHRSLSREQKNCFNGFRRYTINLAIPARCKT